MNTTESRDFSNSSMVAFSSAARSPRAATVRTPSLFGVHSDSIAGIRRHSAISAAASRATKSRRREKGSFGRGEPGPYA